MIDQSYQLRPRIAASPMWVLLTLCIGFVLFLPGKTAFSQQLSLREAMTLVLDKNARLRSLDAERRVSEARVGESRSGYYPRLSASASFTWHQENNIIFPIHQTGVFPPLDDRIFDSNVQLSVPLFNGGKTAARVDVAKAATKQSRAQQQHMRQELLEQLATLFLVSAELQDKQQLLSARREALNRRRAELHALLSEGRATTAQLSLLDAELAAVSADSLGLHMRHQETAWRLGQLTGSREALFPDIRGLQFDPAQATPPTDRSETMRIAKNTDVTNARAILQRQEAMESLAGRSFLPDFSGFALYNYRSGAENWDPAGEWAVGLRLSIPILDGGKRFAGLRGAREQTQMAEYNLLAVELQSLTEGRISIDQWKAATKQQEQAEQAVKRKTEFLHTQQQLHDAGRLTLSELMTQENELLQFQMQERTYRYSILKAALRFHALNGDLTPQTIETLFGDNRR